MHGVRHPISDRRLPARTVPISPAVHAEGEWHDTLIFPLANLRRFRISRRRTGSGGDPQVAAPRLKLGAGWLMAERRRDIVKAREHSQKHYANNRHAMMARAKAHTYLARDRIRAWLLTYLLGHPCTDCGETDPIVLEFDHIEDKKFNIGAANGQGRSLKSVQAEVEKCEVRCANCHRRKTYRDRGFSHRG